MTNAALIKLLADGEFHSGEELGKAAGVTRAAIWKQLKQLEELGVVCESVKGRGYRLSQPLFLLDCNEITHKLDSLSRPKLSALQIVSRIDSTNNYLMQAARDGAPIGTVVLAEQQLSGRGRRGRAWQSPFGRNLYVSILWRFDNGIAALEGLSLAVGAILVEALQDFGINGLALKWPNDILFDSKKLGGILVEMTGDMSGSCAAIIGFGINVNMSQSLGKNIDQPWIDLATIAGEYIDRNALMAVLLNHLLPGLTRFAQSGFSLFQSQWQKYDALLGVEVVASQGDDLLVGISRGITSTGALRIETLSGERVLNGGEVSLRATL